MEMASEKDGWETNNFCGKKYEGNPVFYPVRLTLVWTIRASCTLSAATDGDEKAAFVPESTNPSELREPALKTPVVWRRS